MDQGMNIPASAIYDVNLRNSSLNTDVSVAGRTVTLSTFILSIELNNLHCVSSNLVGSIKGHFGLSSRVVVYQTKKIGNPMIYCLKHQISLKYTVHCWKQPPSERSKTQICWYEDRPHFHPSYWWRRINGRWCMGYSSAGGWESIITRVLLGKLPTNSLSRVTYLFIIY